MAKFYSVEMIVSVPDVFASSGAAETMLCRKVSHRLNESVCDVEHIRVKPCEGSETLEEDLKG